MHACEAADFTVATVSREASLEDVSRVSDPSTHDSNAPSRPAAENVIVGDDRVVAASELLEV